MTTPRDALDGALGYIVDSDPQGHIEWPTADLILLALNAAGWTVARTQDARDGEALRMLREALPREAVTPYIRLVFSAEYGVICHTPTVPFLHPGSPTIADAAEAALSSIEVGE